jgi:hypothetical protein
MDHTGQLQEFLQAPLRGGKGVDLLPRTEKGKCRPSRKFMQHVAQSVRNQVAMGVPTLPAPAQDYVLLDDQIVACDTVLSIVKGGIHRRTKQVLIIRGGQGPASRLSH